MIVDQIVAAVATLSHTVTRNHCPNESNFTIRIMGAERIIIFYRKTPMSKIFEGQNYLRKIRYLNHHKFSVRGLYKECYFVSLALTIIFCYRIMGGSVV